jgi:type 1 glutamine amidotransferase
MPKVFKPSKQLVILSRSLVLALMVLCQGVFAAETDYKEPDPKVIAQVKSIAPTLQAVPCRKKRTVLVYGISFGPHRTTIRTAQEVFRLLGERTGAFEAVVSDDLANFEADKLKQFDAVIFANTTGEVFCRPADKDQFNALGAAERRTQEQNAARLVKNLDDYVRSGGGFMGIHSATDTLKNQKAYGGMIGAVFSQHPWGPKEAVTIRVEDPEHALAKGVFESSGFKFNDEIYEFREPYDRTRLHVILSLDLAKSDQPNRPVRRTDGDFPVAWTRSHGQGRIFYCSLGHAMSVFADPTILKLWLRGIQFSTGDIEAATTPSQPLQPGKGALVH